MTKVIEGEFKSIFFRELDFSFSKPSHVSRIFVKIPGDLYQPKELRIALFVTTGTLEKIIFNIPKIESGESKQDSVNWVWQELPIEEDLISRCIITHKSTWGRKMTSVIGGIAIVSKFDPIDDPMIEVTPTVNPLKSVPPSSIIMPPSPPNDILSSPSNTDNTPPVFSSPTFPPSIISSSMSSHGREHSDSKVIRSPITSAIPPSSLPHPDPVIKAPTLPSDDIRLQQPSVVKEEKEREAISQPIVPDSDVQQNVQQSTLVEEEKKDDPIPISTLKPMPHSPPQQIPGMGEKGEKGEEKEEREEKEEKEEKSKQGDTEHSSPPSTKKSSIIGAMKSPLMKIVFEKHRQRMEEIKREKKKKEQEEKAARQERERQLERDKPQFEPIYASIDHEKGTGELPWGFEIEELKEFLKGNGIVCYQRLFMPFTTVESVQAVRMCLFGYDWQPKKISFIFHRVGEPPIRCQYDLPKVKHERIKWLTLNLEEITKVEQVEIVHESTWGDEFFSVLNAVKFITGMRKRM
ncbi:hypothetical protein ADUPG1_011774 [Aduncisulcus paluster]|uniref:Uncharacterized protein n=1 Tax=Aduncisulcus paluster TaxID=2918883 RepID=A0ABQ5JX25_9EUKA|nr:hypothetical protein ADUPG1_011774 [Aduncisulcus paluster]